MWCIGRLTEEYRQRMYDLLDLYARPFRQGEPVVCLDEKSKQLLKDSRTSLPIRPGAPMCAPAPAICSWQWNPRAGGERSWLPTAAPSPTLWPSSGICSNRSMPRRGASIWSWTTSIPISASASRKCSASRRRSASAPGRLSLHPETRQLAQHGGNRNRHSGSPVSESALAQPRRTRCRGRCLAAAQKCRLARHRVVVHSAGRG